LLFQFEAVSRDSSAILLHEADRVEQTLIDFLATCTEYDLGVSLEPAIRLRRHACEVGELGHWVGQVGQAFVQANLGALSALAEASWVPPALPEALAADAGLAASDGAPPEAITPIDFQPDDPPPDPPPDSTGDNAGAAAGQALTALLWLAHRGAQSLEVSPEEADAATVRAFEATLAELSHVLMAKPELLRGPTQHNNNNPEPTDSTDDKGKWGEQEGNDQMVADGWTPISGQVVPQGHTAPQGIDGIYERINPTTGEPEYVVVESKYGSAQLGNTKDGKQKSDEWIEKRLEEAVGPAKANEIQDKGYEKWLLRVKPDGSITKKRLP
jgi:hypothetical protein